MLILENVIQKRVHKERAPSYPSLSSLLEAVRGCRACESSLPMGPRPVLACDERSRVLIVGQAPGLRVHETGIPWNDRSGERLREWMGIDRETFYDASRIAIIAMGYCYPGKGERGDLPPRTECASMWLGELLKWLPRIELCLLLGLYSQRYFLGDGLSLTDRVFSWRSYPSGVIPLPHPSPRNALWFKKNEWFSKELLPDLRLRVGKALSACDEKPLIGDPAEESLPKLPKRIGRKKNPPHDLAG